MIHWNLSPLFLTSINTDSISMANMHDRLTVLIEGLLYVMHMQDLMTLYITQWMRVIVCNTVCMLVRPKQSQGRFSTRVMLGNEELSFVEKFCSLGHIMTADCRDDKDIKKQFRRQNAVGNMLVRKCSFAPIEVKIQLFQVILLPHLWMCSLASFIDARYSDTFKHLMNVPRYTSSSWHLRWMQLTISMWCYTNLPTAWWAE